MNVEPFDETALVRNAILDNLCRFDRYPPYLMMKRRETALFGAGLENPYFLSATASPVPRSPSRGVVASITRATIISTSRAIEG
jgi:hypothetical protein